MYLLFQALNKKASLWSSYIDLCLQFGGAVRRSQAEHDMAFKDGESTCILIFFHWAFGDEYDNVRTVELSRLG